MDGVGSAQVGGRGWARILGPQSRASSSTQERGLPLGGDAGQPEQQRRASELGRGAGGGRGRQDKGGMLFPGRGWSGEGRGGGWQEMKRQVGKLCLEGFCCHLREQELSLV